MRTSIIFVLFLGLCAAAFGQDVVEVKAKPLTDADIQLIRQDLQSQKNKIIADTMVFDDTEASAFWPIYKQYSSDQQAIAAKRFDLIIDYAQNLEKMDDKKAADLSQRLFTIEDNTQALRKKFYSRFEKALGAKRAAKFYQVDDRLSMILNVQLTSEIPLIP